MIKIYRMLYKGLGPQAWWPAQTPFEVMVGAVLTQNTAWTNVEKAVQNLKGAGALSLKRMDRLPLKALAKLIRPAGYFNLKAARLRALVSWLVKACQGNLGRLRHLKPGQLRKRLLGVYGIGPETADSILLYGLGKKSFVVDAYTKRIFSRHGFIREDSGYEEVKQLFESSLPKSEKIYNEFHALIVKVGKDYCRKTPLCSICPLEKDLLKYRSKMNGKRNPKMVGMACGKGGFSDRRLQSDQIHTHSLLHASTLSVLASLSGGRIPLGVPRRDVGATGGGCPKGRLPCLASEHTSNVSASRTHGCEPDQGVLWPIPSPVTRIFSPDSSEGKGGFGERVEGASGQGEPTQVGSSERTSPSEVCLGGANERRSKKPPFPFTVSAVFPHNEQRSMGLAYA